MNNDTEPRCNLCRQPMHSDGDPCGPTPICFDCPNGEPVYSAPETAHPLKTIGDILQDLGIADHCYAAGVRHVWERLPLKSQTFILGGYRDRRELPLVVRAMQFTGLLHAEAREAEQAGTWRGNKS